MNISVSKIFNKSISSFYNNMGSYSLIKEINSDKYHQLNYEINNISLRIKNGEINTAKIQELYDELLEVQIVNGNINYIIVENSTSENISYGLELLEVLVELFDLLVSYHMENKITYTEYENKLSVIHERLLKYEEYFNHHILKDDLDHEKYVQKHIDTTDNGDESLVVMSESEFLSELEKW